METDISAIRQSIENGITLNIDTTDAVNRM
jgi:hypothetical protein